MLHDWAEPGEDPVCVFEGCDCGKGQMNAAANDAEPRADIPDCKQTSEVAGMIPSQYDHGNPLKGVDTPPSEPATSPGYGPSPTAQGVRGYRDLPADDVSLINAVKLLQESIADVWAAIVTRPGTDQRWARIAQLHLEEGVSALVRSVAKPHDPFRAALERLRHVAEQLAREAVASDLQSDVERQEAPSGKTTVDSEDGQ